MLQSENVPLKQAAGKTASLLAQAAFTAATGGVGAAVSEAAKQLALEKALEFASKHKDLVAALILLPLIFVFLLVFSVSAVFSPVLTPEKGFVGGTPTPYAAEVPPGLMQVFLAAQREFGVAWNVLAAIACIESSFGKNMGPSSAGAVGFMQFMPTTWSGAKNPLARDDPKSPSWDTSPNRIAEYGGYGTDADGDGTADPFNPWDAVFAAARLLKANGYDSDVRRALWHYNHSEAYVNAVMAKAFSYSAEMLPNSVAKALPVPKEYFVISSGYGYREDPFRGGVEFHEGADIAAPEGTPVFSVDAGRVEFVGWDGGYGLCVVVDHGGYKTKYAHLHEKSVFVGETVTAGHPVGSVGSSGRSTGPHLHFGVYVNGRWVDPEAVLVPAD